MYKYTRMCDNVSNTICVDRSKATAEQYVTGFHKPNQIVTIGLLCFIGLVNSYTQVVFTL